jgi:thymidylate synthase
MQHWPWWRGQIDEKMSHTYSERFWPSVVEGDEGTNYFREGIRYRWGDLQDVIQLLQDQPFTRQATLPIFFPEDTGAVHGGRVPCTLHYHFLRRSGKLHLWYAIRSCDAVRHFRDDIYMAARLCQYVISQLKSFEGDSSWDIVEPGMLYFTAYSFHVHRADEHLL